LLGKLHEENKFVNTKKIYSKPLKKGVWIFWLGGNGNEISIINKCANSTSHVFSHAYLRAWFQASHS
jgi:hypothetical protein